MLGYLVGGGESRESQEPKEQPLLAVSKAMARDGVAKGTKIRVKYVLPERCREAMEQRKFWIGTYLQGGGRTVVPEIRCDQMSGVVEIDTQDFDIGTVYTMSLKEGEVWPMIVTHCTTDAVLVTVGSYQNSQNPDPEPARPPAREETKTKARQVRKPVEEEEEEEEEDPYDEVDDTKVHEPIVPKLKMGKQRSSTSPRNSPRGSNQSSGWVAPEKRTVVRSNSPLDKKTSPRRVPQISSVSSSRGSLSPSVSPQTSPRAGSAGISKSSESIRTSPRSASSRGGQGRSSASPRTTGSRPSGTSPRSAVRPPGGSGSGSPRYSGKGPGGTPVSPARSPREQSPRGSSSSGKKPVPEKLIIRMLEELSIRTRMYEGEKVANSFTGISLVSWLVNTVKSIETRADGLRWGRAMMGQAVFLPHVPGGKFVDDHVPFVLNFEHAVVAREWDRIMETEAAAPPSQIKRRPSAPSVVSGTSRSRKPSSPRRPLPSSSSSYDSEYK